MKDRKGESDVWCPFPKSLWLSASLNRDLMPEPYLPTVPLLTLCTLPGAVSGIRTGLPQPTGGRWRSSGNHAPSVNP